MEGRRKHNNVASVLDTINLTKILRVFYILYKNEKVKTMYRYN